MQYKKTAFYFLFAGMALVIAASIFLMTATTASAPCPAGHGFGTGQRFSAKAVIVAVIRAKLSAARGTLWRARR